jgi:hypothetical protein
MDRSMLVYELTHLDEVLRMKYLGFLEVLKGLLVWSVASLRHVLTVMIRVLDGGDGSTSGGRSERSNDSGDFAPEDARERTGEGISAGM